jgi:hypothetical protein
MEPPGGKRPTLFFTSAVSCAKNCHDLKEPLRDDSPPVCRCTEYNIWEGNGIDLPGDKHREAFRLLASDRALEIAKRLGMPREPKQDRRCVNCHGFFVEDEKLLDRPKTIADEGVTCVVCHGAYKNWVGAHHGSGVAEDRMAWRKLTRRQKEDDWGMRDLWDPAERARLCASCHIGSVADGKVLTHDMYAAGHPPLPSFEPAKFSEAMRHWEYLREKRPEVQKILMYDSQERERAHLVAVGGVVVLESSMRLLADEARACAAGSHSLDLACFDCAACHHDWRSPNSRPRGSRSRPGRPSAPTWPRVLIRAIAACAEGHDNKRTAESLREYETLLRSLREAFDKELLGKPNEVALSAGKLADWAALLAKRVGSTSTDQKASVRFARALCGLADDETPDYDSARQIAWAVEMVFADLDPKPRNHADVWEKFATLDRELNLTLPYGRQRKIVDEFEKALEMRTKYDSKKVRKLIGELAQLLSE